MPAIDTHTHFYDPRRSQGVPWPPQTDAVLYQPHLPADFRALAEPLGVVGTVIVEASAWLEDNQWILDLAKDEPFIVGFIGRLEAGKPEFAAQLARFAANPLFRGIRLNAKTLAGGLDTPAFADDLRRLADRGLTLDVVGGADSLDASLRACAAAPGLRVVIDHLPFNVWDDEPEKARAALSAAAGVPLLYAKVSNVLRQREGQPLDDPAVYAPRLDLIWEAFGPQRLVFGSNWPVSNRVGPYALVHRIVADYFAAKGPAAAAQYFWKNSRAAYGWVPRGPAAADLVRRG
jgi:predicted TIM-barrel fold metal-dependent hydrolase